MMNTTAGIRLCGLCVGLALLGAGCGTLDRPAGRDAGAIRDFREIVAQARNRVLPSVLFLKCVVENDESGMRMSQEIMGSGFIISADGEFLTNWHVVNKASSIRCQLTDGRDFSARVIGADRDTDVALCRLDLPPGVTVPAAVLGTDGGVSEGDFVIAMGAPWGLNRSVTFGTVSCARRYLPGHSEYVLWIQTDAIISPGNSGGPLVNTDGEVIGINALGSQMPGLGFGFAIPAREVRVIADAIRRDGRVNWSWCGLMLQPLRDFSRNIRFEANEGVLVAGTEPNSPARRAGLQAQDRIVRLNGTPVTGLTEEEMPTLRRLFGLLPQDQTVHLDVVRNQVPMTIEIVPLAKGRVEGESLDCPRWDFTVKAINQFETPELFLHRNEGVYVFGIRGRGNAQDSDLRPFDVLVRIGTQEVRTLEDVRKAHAAALAGVDRSHRILFTVLRGGRMRQVVLDFGRDFSRE